MAYNKKQRIIGALVLTLVGSVLFPVVFNGGGRFQAELESRIPPEPLIENLSESSQIRPIIIADSEINALKPAADSEIQKPNTSAIFKAPAAAVSEEISEVEEIPSLRQSVLPEGWSIRLGSFAKQENAKNLLERLRASEYKAYTRNISNAAGELVSVLVGPWIDKSVAEDYLVELEDQFRLAGDLVRYDVNGF